MKNLALALVFGAGLASTASAQNVLFFEDFKVGANSCYEDALNSLGWTYTKTTNASDFATKLGSGSWTHVISATQNYGGTAAIIGGPLSTWASSHPGSGVLISDWTMSFDADAQAYLASMGFSVGSFVNFSTVNPVSGEALDGLASASLTNPGWGVFSTETAGSTTVATDEFGNGAIQRNGARFLNGFLSDTFADPTLGRDYIIRELTVPAPGALALVGLGGLVAGRRRR